MLGVVFWKSERDVWIIGMYSNGIFSDQPRNLSYIRQLFFIEVGSRQEDDFSTGIENNFAILPLRKGSSLVEVASRLVRRNKTSTQLNSPQIVSPGFPSRPSCPRLRAIAKLSAVRLYVKLNGDNHDKYV